MFEPRRFRRLAAAHLVERWRSYAWFLGVGIILHLVLVLILMSGERGFMALSFDGQAGIFLVGLMLTAPVFAARYFQAMGRRESALVLLMQPASVFEKWLLALLVVGLLYPAAYTLAFYACDLPAWWIAQARAEQLLADVNAGLTDGQMREWEREALQPENFRLFLPWLGFDSLRDAMGMILALTTLQAFSMLGSLYFRSFPFIKTIVVAFMVLLVSILLASVFDSAPDRFFGYWTDEEGGAAGQEALFLLTWLAVPTLLWLATFSALKEREVA